MREFIEVTGKTEDEAVAKALAQLGLDRDDVSVEILERAKSGFLGLGSCPAKVRVSYGEDTAEEAAPQAPQAPEEVMEAPAPKQEKAPRQEKSGERRPEKKKEPKQAKAPVKETPAPQAAKWTTRRPRPSARS